MKAVEPGLLAKAVTRLNKVNISNVGLTEEQVRSILFPEEEDDDLDFDLDDVYDPRSDSESDSDEDAPPPPKQRRQEKFDLVRIEQE